MTAYLITWKPATENKEKGWPIEELAALSHRLNDTGEAVEPWRFSRRHGVAIGERVFLLRQGRKGPAILGYGSVSSLPDEDSHIATVAFESLVDPTSSSVLATNLELLSINAKKKVWGTQSSGIGLDDAIAAQLEELVVGRLPIPDTMSDPKIANPDWTRDELILALDLYFRVPAARGSKTHPECIKLSAILNSLPIHAGVGHGKTFRNPNGVGMKLSNFLKYDDNYTGVGLTAGSHLEAEVWKTFADNLPLLQSMAAAIISGAKKLSDEGIRTDDQDDEESEEGKILTALHKRRERNPKLVQKKKAQVLSITGALKCEVCEFDFAVRYGSLGIGFAECHHRRAVSTLSPGDKTKLSDLHIVCANCHRMLHRGQPWVSVAELTKRLTSA